MTAALAWLWIKANWRWIGGAVAGLLLASVVWGHFHHDSKVRSERDAARAEAKQAKDDARLWAKAYHSEKGAVDLQNARILKMGQDAAEWQRRAQAATAEAHRANLKAQASAAAFLAIKPKGDTVAERDHDIAERIRRDVQ